MKAEIGGEMDEGIAVKVIDDERVEHTLVIAFDGAVKAHQDEDEYPSDRSEWTRVQSEGFSQARRYAQYYVAKETEYDTIPWDFDSEGLEAARQALQKLSAEEIEQYFGDLLAQSLSHYTTDPDVDTGDIARPHALPEDKIGPDDAILYKQEIYLDDNDEIETVSGVIIEYNVDINDMRTVRHGETQDRDPDACVEIYPAPLVAPEAFRDYLRYNLRCQIRDCYVGMGLEPPEEYRVLGPGKFLFAGKYEHFDCYPPYHDTNADIPGYSHEFRPDLPITWGELDGIVDSGSSQSIYEQIKTALFSR
jgi:hypothetical protein